mgnify:CR=1 FL=1
MRRNSSSQWIATRASRFDSPASSRSFWYRNQSDLLTVKDERSLTSEASSYVSHQNKIWTITPKNRRLLLRKESCERYLRYTDLRTRNATPATTQKVCPGIVVNSTHQYPAFLFVLAPRDITTRKVLTRRIYILSFL